VCGARPGRGEPESTQRVRSTDRVFEDRTTGPRNTIWESSRATPLSESDSTASVLSCFTKSRRRGSHRFLRSRLRTEGRSKRLGGPRRRKRLGCRHRHAEARNQPVRFLGSSHLPAHITPGIEAAILSPQLSGEPWHIAGTDPQMGYATKKGRRRGGKSGHLIGTAPARGSSMTSARSGAC
jgi:hypothetical protein